VGRWTRGRAPTAAAPRVAPEESQWGTCASICRWRHHLHLIVRRSAPCLASRRRRSSVRDFGHRRKGQTAAVGGVDVVGFGAGEPDFPTPPAIVEAAVAACKDPRKPSLHPTGGLAELKEAIVSKTARDSRYEITPKQVIVTNGGKHAIYNAFAALLDPGDEVLVPAPYWTTYPEAIRLAGGVPVEVPTGSESGFKVTVDQLQDAATDRTKVLLFVSPSNPTGAVYSREQIAEIGRVAVERGWWCSPTRSTSILSTKAIASIRCRSWCQSSPSAASSPTGRQDLRDDRLACRMDDRSGRHRGSCHEPPVAHDLKCQQRRTARRDSSFDGTSARSLR